MVTSEIYDLEEDNIVIIKFEDRLYQRRVLRVSPSGEAVEFNNLTYSDRWLEETEFELIDVLGTVDRTPFYKTEDFQVVICFLITGLIFGYLFGLRM